jgi:multiple sugar transport system substrate-binding protein
MLKKIGLYSCLLAIVLLSAACGRQNSQAAPGAAPGEFKGNLVVWSWADTFSAGIMGEYTRMHSDVSFEFIPIQSDDMLTKIQQTLASGGEMPDVITYESQWFKRANDMDLNVHLDDYGVKVSDYMDFTSTSMLDKNGHIQGLNYTMNIGAINIKTDMARKYLGTTNRDELVEMFSTTDKLIALGQKINAETNGRIKMFGDMMLLQFWFNFRTGAACVNENGEFELTKNHLPVYENLLRFWRSGIIDNVQPGTPAHIGLLSDDTHIAMVSVCGDIFFTIQPTDPEGKVALIVVPLPQDVGSFQLGGTTFGVPKTSKNIPLAVDFIKYFLHDLEGVKWVRDNLGGFVPLKAAFENPATFGPYTYKNFGDFDYGSFYLAEAASRVPAIPYSEYDQVVRQAMSVAESEMLINDAITAQQLLELEIAEVKARLPDVVIK